jgi:hypothetical protein
MPLSMLPNAWLPKFFVSKRRIFTPKSTINLNHIRNEQMKVRGFVDYAAWRSDRNIDLAITYAAQSRCDGLATAYTGKPEACFSAFDHYDVAHDQPFRSLLSSHRRAKFSAERFSSIGRHAGLRRQRSTALQIDVLHS